MINWLKWMVAGKELKELERWRVQWQRHRQWFAEFEVASVALDHMKCDVDGRPVTDIITCRDSFRKGNV